MTACSVWLRWAALARITTSGVFSSPVTHFSLGGVMKEKGGMPVQTRSSLLVKNPLNMESKETALPRAKEVAPSMNKPVAAVLTSSEEDDMVVATMMMKV
ncbi:MAG: hypothetical protein SGARI_007201, partial [Bacillariaceae sp.]